MKLPVLALPSDLLAVISLGCLAASILLCVVALVWLTPITGLVCFFVGSPLLLAGLAGNGIVLLRELLAGRHEA